MHPLCVMCRYSEDGKTPVKLKILDLQMSIGSLLELDLLYFFFTSTRDTLLIPNFDVIMEVRIQNRKSIEKKLFCAFVSLSNFEFILIIDVQKYHTSLSGTLARLQYKKQRPGLDQVKLAMREMSIYGYQLGCNLAHIIFTG